MPEAEASLERLYFKTILLNCSYNFLYRGGPRIAESFGARLFLFRGRLELVTSTDKLVRLSQVRA